MFVDSERLVKLGKKCKFFPTNVKKFLIRQESYKPVLDSFCGY
jgi:hypothetical protein